MNPFVDPISAYVPCSSESTSAAVASDAVQRDLTTYAGAMKARLLDGTGRAADDQGACQYRTHDNRACLVGLLFTDEEIELLNSKNDGKYNGSANGLLMAITRFGIPKPALEQHILFFQAMQQCHDNLNHWDDKEFNRAGKAFFNGILAGYGIGHYGF